MRETGAKADRNRKHTETEGDRGKCRGRKTDRQ